MYSVCRMNDGWESRPRGWNSIDVLEYDDNLIQGVDLSDFDAIDYLFVLAGGLDHLGRNHPWVKDRLDIALQLYRIRRRKIVILGGGTYHKPPHLNKEKFVLHESTMGARYLIDQGVLPADLYREWASYDTIANGFFSLVNFVIPLGINRILVITSDFHIERSRAIFDWIYGLWSDFSGSVCSDDRLGVEISYLPVSSSYLDQDIIQARADREMRSLEHLQTVIRRVTDWQAFHEWFYQEHKAYNCQFDDEKSEKIDHIVAQSY